MRTQQIILVFVCYVVCTHSSIFVYGTYLPTLVTTVTAVCPGPGNAEEVGVVRSAETKRLMMTHAITQSPQSHRDRSRHR
jgi:hypothetical protein